MQDNTITLGVDVANDSNVVNAVFTRHSEELNRSIYNEAGHTLASRDTLTFNRTAPKPNGDSRGMARSAIKFTQDVSVANASGDGTIVLPLIGEVSFSVPVGTTPAQTMELRQRIIAILDDDAISAPLMDTLDI